MGLPTSQLKEQPSSASIFLIHLPTSAMASQPPIGTGFMLLQASISTIQTASRCSWKRLVSLLCVLNRHSSRDPNFTLTWGYSQLRQILPRPQHQPPPRILCALHRLVQAEYWSAAHPMAAWAAAARFASGRLPHLNGWLCSLIALAGLCIPFFLSSRA